MTATALPPLRCFAVTSANPRVDADKGIIFGVSLITSGLIAKGHDLEVDQTTLEQMLSCAEAKEKLPVKWNHKTGADAVSGYLKNFRIEGRKLVGDWHLLKSHERYQHALELATEMPECLGLSTSFRGADEVVGDKKFARCTDLVSADLVASPAANPDGFFEVLEPSVDSGAGGMGKPSTTTGAAEPPAKEFTIADVMAGITAINTRIDGLDGRITSFETALEEAREFEEQEQELEHEPEAEPHEFADGAEALQYLQERLAAIEDQAEQAKVDHAFSVYEDKVGKLIELNEQLLMENRVMAEAIQEFTEKTGTQVTFTPGTEGGFVHNLSVPETDGRAPTTDFEVRVAELSASGKEATEAIRTAMKEDPARYQRHLQEIGVVAKRL